MPSLSLAIKVQTMSRDVINESILKSSSSEIYSSISSEIFSERIFYSMIVIASAHFSSEDSM